jgi:hypothetical protein
MKHLLFLLFAVLFTVSPALSQKWKAAHPKSEAPASIEKADNIGNQTVSSDDEPPPPPPAPKSSKVKYSSSEVFRNVAVEKWDIVGLSIPQDLTGGTESFSTSSNKNVEWVTYSRNWRHPAPVSPGLLDVELTVTTWNTDFKNVVPDLRPELATPETLLYVDVRADAKKKDEPDSLVKESSYMELGGVKGGFFRAEFPADQNRFMAGWYTYRYFEGKAQRISLTVTGSKTEQEKLIKIIQSLRFQ